MPNRLRNFLGKRPIEINGVGLYSPTIDQIDEIGELQYNVYLAIATFNKKAVFQDLLGLSDDDYETLEEEDTYKIFTSFPAVLNELIKALSFFTKKEVEYDYLNYSFCVGEVTFLTNKNYKEVSKVIRQQNGIVEEKQDEGVKLKSERAKKMYEELLRLKQERKKRDDSNDLSLKDMLSVLCNAEGNGINIFNVSQLTIYQVYEQFERLNIKEHHIRMLKVWSNDKSLEENSKLPEWIVKGKL